MTSSPIDPSDAARDRDLLRRLRLGDVEAFERIFRAYQPLLTRVVTAYVRSPATAGDVVQDVFFALWARRAELEIRGSLRSYLLGAARNEALRWLRHDAVVRRFAESDDPTAAAGRPAPLAAVDAAEEAAEGAAMLSRLEAAIAVLPERTRLAVRLRWLEQMSHADVAAAMGVSVKAVEKLLHGALGRLRGTFRGTG